MDCVPSDARAITAGEDTPATQPVSKENLAADLLMKFLLWDPAA